MQWRESHLRVLEREGGVVLRLGPPNLPGDHSVESETSEQQIGCVLLQKELNRTDRSI